MAGCRRPDTGLRVLARGGAVVLALTRPLEQPAIGRRAA
jgi:hypothetical protein